MLRVSIHAGPLREISRFNRVDWVDIGYDQLGVLANYKVVLFNVGEGVTPPVRLSSYPRWSASLWDLTARAIALGLSSDRKNPEEKVHPAPKIGKRYAYARALSAVIQHFPNSGTGVRQLADMEILQAGSTRGFYRAQVNEDLMSSKATDQFTFAPAFLRPAELVLRSALMVLAGNTDSMPPRPKVALPMMQMIDGKPHVVIHNLAEPARTGFTRWLYDHESPPTAYAGTPEGIAPEAQFVKFMNEAI
jgi:hypothetical protein